MEQETLILLHCQWFWINTRSPWGIYRHEKIQRMTGYEQPCSRAAYSSDNYPSGIKPSHALTKRDQSNPAGANLSQMCMWKTLMCLIISETEKFSHMRFRTRRAVNSWINCFRKYKRTPGRKIPSSLHCPQNRWVVVGKEKQKKCTALGHLKWLTCQWY